MENQFRYDTYCGLNCGACPVLAANERGDEAWIKATAEQWKKKPEDLRCHGCKTDVTAAFCTNCGMRNCARERGLEFCVECDEYPCDKISAFRNDDASHHSVVFTNLAIIKDKGVEAWLASDAKRWACPECGTRFYWYSEKCEECGAVLYNAVKQEKYLGNQ
jgi:predicted RNA-binding Zn-ribbon protein involved in translation (DUF1610 family)